MISPCGGCDLHFAAAVICYLSFFVSSCSFFLYWWWLSIYREEQNPNSSTSRYDQDPDSDCVTLDVDNPQVPEEIHQIYDEEEEEPTEEASCSLSPPNKNKNKNKRNNQLPCLESTTTTTTTTSDDIIIISTENNQNNEDEDGNDNAVNDSSIIINKEEEDQEDDDNPQEKSALSDNPYLNGNTYSHNVLWGLHGIFTNLIEAILAAVFYRGLFEDNLTTTLIFVIGFTANFVVGNLLYVLLLVYCTNVCKVKELRVRWALESTFNILKDLYYIWVAAAFLHQLFQNRNS